MTKWQATFLGPEHLPRELSGCIGGTAPCMNISLDDMVTMLARFIGRIEGGPGPLDQPG